MARTVWAHSELKELGGQTGFVVVENDALADKLLKAGEVQDPYLTEPLYHVGAGPGKRTRYLHRQMTAAKAEEARKPPPPPEDEDKPDKAPKSAETADDKPRRGRPPKDK